MNIKNLLYRKSLSQNQIFFLGLIGILVLNFLFKFIFTPPLDQMEYCSLVSNPVIFDTLKEALHHHPFSVLLPLEYQPERVYWAPTIILPFYLLSKIFSPLANYVFVSSLLIVTTYFCSWKILRSLVFSSTLAILLALGTQLSYALTIGNILALYILLAYITLNMTSAIIILQKKFISKTDCLFFALTLLICAIGNEMWINYEIPLILSLGFIALWANHHNLHALKKNANLVNLISITILLVYLTIRLFWAKQYLKPGAEEELILTHHSPFLMIDDFITNFFTLLYMSLSNYLPSFLFFSNSSTYVGEAGIIAGQNGYLADKMNLAVASYLLQWRFYAGIFTVPFFMFGWKWFRAAWSDKTNFRALVLFILFIGVITGFATHLLIKMRIYNTTPMLTYKAMFSTFSFTLMIAYVVMIARDHFRNVLIWRRMIVGVWLFILLAAITRPAAMNAGLLAVDCNGYSDPGKQLVHLFKHHKHSKA